MRERKRCIRKDNFAMKPMLTVTVPGNFNKTERFFERIKNAVKMGTFDKYGEMGVKALASATPIDTGKTSESWTYEVIHYPTCSSIVWSNTNVTSNGTSVAILLQYGHGLKNGGYVAAKDYINPAMIPVFDKIANDMWEEVIKV